MRTLKKLSTGDIVAGVCSILLVLLAFTKTWAKYTIGAGGESDSEGATLLDADAFNLLAKLAVLAALVAAIVFIVRAARGGPANAATLYLVLGGAAFVLLLITMITGPQDLTGALEKELPGVTLDQLEELGVTVDAARGVMLYVGLLLSAGIAAGGFMLKGSSAAGESPAAPAV